MSNGGQTRFLHRPNKEYSRRSMLDLIAQHTTILDNVEEYCYISLAGFRFLDSVLAYRRFGLKNLISLEADEAVIRRAQFNRPYHFIEVIPGTIEAFLDMHLPKWQDCRKILFLDYNRGLSQNILHELELVSRSEVFSKPGIWFLAFNARLDVKCSFYRDHVPHNIVTQADYFDWLKTFIPERIRGQLRHHHHSMDLMEICKFRYFDTSRIMLFGFRIGRAADMQQDFAIYPVSAIEVPDLTRVEKHLIRNNPQITPAQFYDDYGIPEHFTQRFREYD